MKERRKEFGIRGVLKRSSSISQVRGVLGFAPLKTYILKYPCFTLTL